MSASDRFRFDGGVPSSRRGIARYCEASSIQAGCPRVKHRLHIGSAERSRMPSARSPSKRKITTPSSHLPNTCTTAQNSEVRILARYVPALHIRHCTPRDAPRVGATSSYPSTTPHHLGPLTTSPSLPANPSSKIPHGSASHTKHLGLTLLLSFHRHLAYMPLHHWRNRSVPH